ARARGPARFRRRRARARGAHPPARPGRAPARPRPVAGAGPAPAQRVPVPRRRRSGGPDLRAGVPGQRRRRLLLPPTGAPVRWRLGPRQSRPGAPAGRILRAGLGALPALYRTAGTGPLSADGPAPRGLRDSAFPVALFTFNGYN